MVHIMALTARPLSDGLDYSAQVHHGLIVSAFVGGAYLHIGTSVTRHTVVFRLIGD